MKPTRRLTLPILLLLGLAACGRSGAESVAGPDATTPARRSVSADSVASPAAPSPDNMPEDSTRHKYIGPTG